mgnify:CR=1 FL=1
MWITTLGLPLARRLGDRRSPTSTVKYGAYCGTVPRCAAAAPLPCVLDFPIAAVPPLHSPCGRVSGEGRVRGPRQKPRPILGRASRGRPQMAKEKFDIQQHVTNAIIKAIEDGAAPWRQPWTGGGAVSTPTERSMSAMALASRVQAMVCMRE